MDWIVDADAHVTESADVWIERLPSKWRNEAPQMRRDQESGEDYWYIGGERSDVSVGATGPAGFTEDWGLLERPRNFDELPKAAWNAQARLKYLDGVRTWAQVIYPNVGGFGNQAFFNLPDKDLRIACVTAYNDWIHEWCRADADRLLPIMALPFWDVDACVKEIDRCAQLGHRGILFTGEPHRFGMPYLGDPRWDPVWSAAVANNLSVSFHIGSGDMEGHLNNKRFETQGQRVTMAWLTTSMFLTNGFQVADMLLSGVLPRFPELKVVSVESGAGWLPFVLESADYLFEQYRAWKDVPQFEYPPSEYFRRQMFVTTFFEVGSVASFVDAVGGDNLMFETDYPHPVCLYGDRVEQVLNATFSGLPAEVSRKVTWTNGAKIYGVREPIVAAT